MTKDSTVKDLINQASNTKHLVDEVNRAMYGYTMDEVVNPKGGERDEGSTGRRGNKGTA